MDRRFKQFSNILCESGAFSRPFLNYLREKELKTPKNDSEKAWRFFFDGLRNEQFMESEEALKSYEHGLKYTKRNSLRYLLLARKLSIFLKTGRAAEGHKIYNYLRNNFSRIPPDIRYKAIVSTLVAYCALKESYQNCIGKLKVEKMESSIKAFIALNAGRELIKNKDLRKGIQKLLESYRLSEESFHPAGMIMSINGAAWYMRNLHPVMAVRLGEKAVYFAGRYSEFNKYFFAIDTLFTVILTQKMELIQPVTRLVVSFSYKLNDSQSKHFKLALKEAKYLYQIQNDTTSIHKNTIELRKYMKKQNKNISSISSITGIDRKTISGILEGKTREIRGDTLRKYIEGMDLKPDILNSPKQIVKEWYRINHIKISNIETDKLLGLDSHERCIRVFSFYSSMVRRKDIQPLLTRKGSIDIFFNILNKNDELKAMTQKKLEIQDFMNFIGTCSPYEKARMELITIFLSEFKKRKQKELMCEYFEANEETRTIIDRFMRNYVRYDREWGVRLENEEYMDLAKKVKLKVQPFLVSIYCFEKKKERRITKEFFEKL